MKIPNLQKYVTLLSLIAVIPLYGCGGGGGQNNFDLLTLDFSIERGKIYVGEATQLVWSSVSEAECVLNDRGNIINISPSGSYEITATEGGRYSFRVKCSKSGQTLEKLVELIVPMPIYSTSYENKNSIKLENSLIAIPFDNKVENTEVGINLVSTSFADFFQDGTYAVFGASLNIKGKYPGVPAADTPGYAYFYKKNIKGVWVDASNELFKSVEERKVCIGPNYSLVADFNNDKKPDLFVSCTGIDWDMPNGGNVSNAEREAWYFSPQIIFLSGKDGYYSRKELKSIYGHQASAGDINKDGNIDLLVLTEPPEVWLGKGDGTFTSDRNILNSDWRLKPGISIKPWFNIDYSNFQLEDGGTYAAQLIPINGRLDLLLGDNYLTHWTKGKPDGGFDFETTRVFPTIKSQVTGIKYQFPLDALYINGSFYLNTNTNAPNITDWAILKCGEVNLNCSVHYQFTVRHDVPPQSNRINASVLIRSDLDKFIRPTGLLAPSAVIEPDSDGDIGFKIRP